MTERLPDADAALERLGRALRGTAGRVFVPGAGAEPLLFADAFRRAPELAGGVTFLGVWIPGINRIDWAGLHPDARGETTFSPPESAASRASGRLIVRPLAYTQTWDWLARTPLHAALFQVSAPDGDGLCSFGLAADFPPMIVGRPGFKLAHVNPLMPAVRNGPRVPLSAFDAVVEAAHPLLTVPSTPGDAETTAIAARVAALIPDGAAVQVGIGKLGGAVLAALTGRRDLRIHSGLVSDGVLDLIDAGAIADDAHAIVTGVALGSTELYRRIAVEPRTRFATVPETHGLAALAAVPGLCAVNSAVEVDLYGQADAETVGGRAVSGVGGLTDFLRGAQASPGGTPIVALPSTAKGGSVSRIVSRLASGLATVNRTDMGVVVTEHGTADLRGLSIEERAAALISVAAPQHREALGRAWRERS